MSDERDTGIFSDDNPVTWGQLILVAMGTFYIWVAFRPKKKVEVEAE